MSKKKFKTILCGCITALCLLLTSCGSLQISQGSGNQDSDRGNQTTTETTFASTGNIESVDTLEEVPEYTGQPYVEINDNEPIFTEDELMEMSAVAQSSPGAIAVNLAALSGYKAAGTAGAVISCAASVIPPLVILGIISGFYDLFIANKIVAAVLKGMQSGVAALIVSVVADMCTVILKEKSFFLFSLIPIAFIANFIFDVNVALILAVCCGLCILRVYVRSGGHKWKFF